MINNSFYRLPQLTAPPFGLLWDVALDGLTIAIVSYTVSMSMALIFAQRLNYKVNANQELLAQVLFFFVTVKFKTMWPFY